MTTEDNLEEQNNRSWNDQLIDLVRQSGQSASVIARRAGISGSTFRDYLSRKITNLWKVADAKKIALYELTRLECFNSAESNIYTNVALHDRSVQESPAELETLSVITKIERELANLKFSLARKNIRTDEQGTVEISQPYETAKLLEGDRKYSLEERTRVFEIALDLLVDQADYFRRASESERKYLLDSLRACNGVDRWGYAVNLFDNLAKPDGTADVFVRNIEPPKKYNKGKIK